MTEEYDFCKHYNLSLDYKKKGLTGLANLGNTCFMNSIIQCLSNNLKLTEFFLKEKFKEEDLKINQKKEYQLILCYTNLLRNIWDSNTVLKPRSFKSAIGKLISKYDNGTQQDSHEFLVHLLENLHKGLCYEIEVGIKGEIIKNCDKLMVECINTWTNYFNKEYSIIIDLYYGMFFNNLLCNSCNNTSLSFEPYSCLSLSIDGKKNLEECLDNYFLETTINDFNCEKCNKTGANKKVNFWTLPNFLIINLKRFNNKNRKLTNLIDFKTEDLNLTNYISKDKEDPNHYIYTLYAVNYHTGDTNGGHYYSVVKNLDDNFYLMNDGNVTKISSKDQIVNENAYILFYFRKFIQ